MSFDRYIASVSFGKDSLAMVLLILERGLPLDEVVFYDTGMEFKAIYDTRDRALPILYDHGVKYTELRPPRPFLFDMMEKPVSSKKNGQQNKRPGQTREGGRKERHSVHRDRRRRTEAPSAPSAV